MPLCPNCASQQPDGAAFCDECGAKLSEITVPAAPPVAAMPQYTPTVVGATCPVCGASVTPGEAFCDNCGAALGHAASAPPPHATMAPPTSAATVPAPGQVHVLTCSNCGAQLEPGSNFCDMCGTPVGAGLPATPPPASVPATPPASAPVTPSPVLEPAQVPPPTTSPPAPAPTQDAQHPYSAPSPPPVHLPGAAIPGRLVVQSTNTTLPFPPGKTEIIVGREDPVSGVFPEIDLTHHGADEAGVSRRHARIFIQGTQVFIEDLNSTNYTYVNQQKLTPGQPHPLNDENELRLGRVKLFYYV